MSRASCNSIHFSMTSRAAVIGSCSRTTSPTACSAVSTLFEHMLKRLKLTPGEISPDGAVSVDLTSCTGMCDQGPAALVNNQRDHAAHRAPRRRDVRSRARRRLDFGLAVQLFSRRRQHSPRRRDTRLALRPGLRVARRNRARSAGHARRDEALESARPRRRGIHDLGQMGGLPQCARRRALYRLQRRRRRTRHVQGSRVC